MKVAIAYGVLPIQKERASEMTLPVMKMKRSKFLATEKTSKIATKAATGMQGGGGNGGDDDV